MKTDQVLNLTTTFAGHAQQTEAGVEHWLTCGFQILLQDLILLNIFKTSGLRPSAGPQNDLR